MSIKQTTTKSTVTVGKQRSYNDVVEFLDKNWGFERSGKTIERMKKLDKALGSPSNDLNTIAIAGTNGKSLTIHFIARLLKEEGLSVGTFVDPHILTYNELLATNGETISNKEFTELALHVIDTAQNQKLDVSSREVLTMMALLYFKNKGVDAALIEVTEGGQFDPTSICSHKVVGITRVTEDDIHASHKSIEDAITDITNIVSKGTWVVSGDQNKTNLQLMESVTKSRHANWAMPIRKLAPIAYPFEQLHGRCAAIAERTASMFIEHVIVAGGAHVVQDSLLARESGRRGRPTLEAKRQSELNPKRTIEQYWAEIATALPGRFQLLEKEKPTILLDNANNLDAFKNLLLGVRLMHYQRSLKGLTLIVGTHGNELDNLEFFKLIRYFFKKTSGQIFLCPVETKTLSHQHASMWNIEKVVNELKNMKVKARAFKDFKEALDQGQKSVDERHGLVVVTGSHAIVSEYWNHKEIKKL